MTVFQTTLLLLICAQLSDGKTFNVVTYGALGDGVTDNSAAFYKCISAAIAASGGKIVFPAGVFVGNIVIPPVTDWLTLEIVGDSEPTPVFGTVGSARLSNHGTVIQYNSSHGVSAVVRAQAGPANSFSNVFIVLKDLQIRTSDNPTIGGLDLSSVQQCKVEKSTELPTQRSLGA